MASNRRDGHDGRLPTLFAVTRSDPDVVQGEIDECYDCRFRGMLGD